MTDQPTRRSRRTTLRAIPVAVLGLLIAVLAPAPAAVAQPGTACENRANVTYSMLLECMTLEGVREHQAAFQAIADANDDPFYPGTRAAGTEGYANSVDYVAGLLKDAGYEVTLDPVDITFNFPAVLRQLTPVVAEYESGVFTGSGSGTVEGQDPRRHQPHAPARIDERVRGGGLRRHRLERRRRHRARAARHLLLRGQSTQCGARGRRGRHHLQPGQHS